MVDPEVCFWKKGHKYVPALERVCERHLVQYQLPESGLRSIASIIRRQSPRFAVTRKALRDLDQRICALLIAIGSTVIEDEYSRAFREAVEAIPTARETNQAFYRIANAPNPLDPAICSARGLAALNRLARVRWPGRPEFQILNRAHHLIGVTWDELAKWQQESVRQMALELAEDAKTRIVQGAPAKDELNGLLIELADIFLSATDQHIDRFDLPSEPASLFIQFAHAVAAPYLPGTEASAKALSGRWARLKKHEKRRFGPIRPAQQRIRRRPNKLNF